MTVLGVETIIQTVELSGNENENVLVIGRPGSGKSVSYIRPNILLEEEKSLLIVDLHKEEFVYTYKEKLKQGYTVLEYDISSETIFEDFRNDLITHESEKVAIYLHNSTILSTFSAGPTPKERGLLVQDFFGILLNNEAWNQSLHLIIDDSELCPLPDIATLLSKAKSYNIGVSIIIQSISGLERIYDKQYALNIIDNCESILYIGGRSQQDAEFLSDLTLDTADLIIDENSNSKPYISPEEILNMKHNNALLIEAGKKPKIIEKLFVGDKPTIEGDQYWDKAFKLLLEIIHIYAAEDKGVEKFTIHAWLNTKEILNKINCAEDLEKIISALDSSHKIKDEWLEHRPKGNIIGLLLEELKVAARSGAQQ